MEWFTSFPRLQSYIFRTPWGRLFRGAKRQPQTSGKKQVIFFDSGGRITQKIVIETELPAEPFADRGGKHSIERISVAARPADVRKIIECFAEGRAAAEFCVELLSHIGYRISLRDGREGKSRWRWRNVRQRIRPEKFLVVPRPTEDVELRVLRFDQVVSDTTIDHILKIQILERVGVKIRRTECKPLRPEIYIGAQTTRDLVRNHLARRRRVIFPIHRGGIRRDLVEIRLAYRSSRESVGKGSRIASR